MVDDLQDTTGVILVGGKSRRMGVTKSFLQLGGQPLIERTMDLFRSIFQRVLLIGNDPEPYRRYSLPIYPDIFEGSSLGGLYSGIVHAGSRWTFVAPCDLPYPSGAVVRHLLSLRSGHEAVVPRSGNNFEPLFAAYSTACREPMRRLLERGNFCIFDLYPSLDVRYVAVKELASLPGGDRTFINLNTPEEFARAARESS